MEKAELDNLRKLPPKDRLAKLKKLKQSRRNDIKEIADLITKSQSDLTEQIADEIAPEISRVHIDDLFEQQGNALERSVGNVPRAEDDEEQGYTIFKQLYSDYTELKDISYTSMMGSLSTSKRAILDEIGERLNKTKYHGTSEQLANILVASRSALYKIRKYAGWEQ